MVSRLTWLDNSRDEQRRIRELLALFGDSESRDELGVGQLRDAVSDMLFPGVSTLHTRARYLLIVPWCHRTVADRGLRVAPRSRDVETVERHLIATLRRAGVTDGLIGRQAGAGVQALPSALYWTALGRFGIRHSDRPLRLAQRLLADADELDERRSGPWHAGLPPAPRGFPTTLEGGLDLLPHEAGWLRDRVLTRVGTTLLAHCLESTFPPEPTSAAPWDDPSTDDLAPESTERLRCARLFSLAVHGAALLYNLQIAERYEEAGLTGVDEPVAAHRSRLRDWETLLAADPAFARWPTGDLWVLAETENPRIAANPRMRRFVDGWVAALQERGAGPMADDDHLRRLCATVRRR